MSTSSENCFLVLNFSGKFFLYKTKYFTDFFSASQNQKNVKINDIFGLKMCMQSVSQVKLLFAVFKYFCPDFWSKYFDYIQRLI